MTDTAHPDYYLGDRKCGHSVQDFDGRLRACWVLGRPVIRYETRDVRAWLVRCEPPLPVEDGEASEIVFYETTGRPDLETTTGCYVPVFVYSLVDPGRGELGILKQEDLRREYDRAEVARTLADFDHPLPG